MNEAVQVTTSRRSTLRKQVALKRRLGGCLLALKGGELDLLVAMIGGDSSLSALLGGDNSLSALLGGELDLLVAMIGGDSSLSAPEESPDNHSALREQSSVLSVLGCRDRCQAVLGGGDNNQPAQ